jgi:hypothetical protein
MEKMQAVTDWASGLGLATAGGRTARCTDVAAAGALGLVAAVVTDGSGIITLNSLGVRRGIGGRFGRT